MADEQKVVKNLMVKRTQLVDGLLSVLERKVNEAEKGLLKQTIEQFMDRLELTADGKVKNTLFNKRLLANIDTVFTKFGKSDGVEIAKTIASGVQSVVNFAGTYYSNFTTKAKLLEIKPAVKETTAAWLGLGEKGGVTKNGYLDTIIQNNTVKNTIKDFALRTVVGQQGWMEAKKQLSEIVVGAGDKAGAMKKYYRNFVYDTYSQVDRATGQIYAEKLGFEFYIYEGGLIKGSRQFCRERNGKVFHKSEIAEFDPTEAKQPGYNPFTDLGGYGCRHHLNGIPASLAFILRPDLKVKFGGGALPQPTAKPIDPKTPSKQVEQPKVIEPANPDKFGVDSIVNTRTAKVYLGEVVKNFAINGTPPKISISSTLKPDQLRDYSKQVAKLFDEYFLNSSEIEEIKFKSTARSYGAVAPYRSGKLKYINFGDRVDKNRIADYTDGATKISKQAKSRVDEKNLQISTATHEFAHAMGIKQVASGHTKNFFDELAVIRRDYHNEVNTLIRDGKVDAAGKIYLGKYASTNIDEFWAESFTEFKLKTNPSKYATLVGKLANKYFKKIPEK